MSELYGRHEKKSPRFKSGIARVAAVVTALVLTGCASASGQGGDQPGGQIGDTPTASAEYTPGPTATTSPEHEEEQQQFPMTPPLAELLDQQAVREFGQTLHELLNAQRNPKDKAFNDTLAKVLQALLSVGNNPDDVQTLNALFPEGTISNPQQPADVIQGVTKKLYQQAFKEPIDSRRGVLGGMGTTLAMGYVTNRQNPNSTLPSTPYSIEVTVRDGTGKDAKRCQKLPQEQSATDNRVVRVITIGFPGAEALREGIKETFPDIKPETVAENTLPPETTMVACMQPTEEGWKIPFSMTR